jgi:hypothetical protein
MNELKCNSDNTKIKSLYIMNYDDLKIEGNEIVGIKRKYGKRKREVLKINNIDLL